MRSVTVRTGAGKFGQRIKIGAHELVGDEPVKVGGDDSGPDPYELVLAGLGTCTSMTVKMYADRKGWPLSAVEVELVAAKKEDAWVVERLIRLEGELTEEQRGRLLEIAEKCPVHKTLTGEIRIETGVA
ncbi:OsmC family protein [Polyangium aurulentum]|uniref:OsmC family protein n=1 Tax=Polyangium aurulentum TaxID=2567896 RepID=UPI0010AE1889|nr:OsmC family protein [Polyangium aurulentum]UQA59276.1 OsmC family protein [Polyangium aurulentum]